MGQFQVLATLNGYEGGGIYLRPASSVRYHKLGLSSD